MKLYELIRKLNENAPVATSHSGDSRPMYYDPEGISYDSLPIDYSERAKKLVVYGRGLQHLGTGYFSTAMQHKDRPEDVLKGSRPQEPDSIDGFYIYAKALLKSDIRDNPHFPRIRSFREFKNKTTEQISYQVRLETLSNGSRLTREEIDYLIEKTFSDYGLSLYTPSDHTGPEGVQHDWWWIASMIDSVVLEGTKDEAIKDENLLEALRFTRELANTTGYSLDLHAGNLLVRKTPYGPQLVILDPIGFVKVPSPKHMQTENFPTKEYDRPITRADKPFFDRRHFPQDHRVQKLGSGYFASAATDINRPEEVLKISRALTAPGHADFVPNTYNSRIDGYYDYILAIKEDEKIQSNPYIPRILDLKVFKSPDNHIKYQVRMERLLPLDELNKKQLAQITRQIFGDRYQNILKLYFSVSIEGFFERIVNKARAGLIGPDFIEDEQFIKALEFISSVSSDCSRGIDLHGKNMMIRNTPYGMQLVFTDPLAF